MGGSPYWGERVEPLGGGPRQAALLDLVLEVTRCDVDRERLAARGPAQGQEEEQRRGDGGGMVML